MAETSNGTYNRRSFDDWLFEYSSTLHSTTLETAFDRGFVVTHIGGGALALRKDTEQPDTYWLITDSTYIGEDLDPDAADWTVGKYTMHEDSTVSVIVVEEKTTLDEALGKHILLPDPAPDETGQASYTCHVTWADATAPVASRRGRK